MAQARGRLMSMPPTRPGRGSRSSNPVSTKFVSKQSTSMKRSTICRSASISSAKRVSMISLLGSSFGGRRRLRPYLTGSLSSSRSSCPDAIQRYCVRSLTLVRRAMAALLIPCST